LKLKLKQKGMPWDAIAFKMGNRVNEIGGLLNIVFTLELDNWNGNERLRLNILDFTTVS
jgi:hypothetical protein